MLTIDALAQEIRRVDGNHSLGAGALAEALYPFLSAALSALVEEKPGVKAVQTRQGVEGRAEAFEEAARLVEAQWNHCWPSDIANSIRALVDVPAAIPTANCCICGRIIDTREKSEGGDDHGDETAPGKWTCSIQCYDAFTGYVPDVPAVEQEPVAWLLRDPDGVLADQATTRPQDKSDLLDVIPLYASPVRSAIAPAPAEETWQPIETAPEDGSMFDVWCVNPQHSEAYGVRFNNVRMRGDGSGFGFVMYLRDGVYWQYLDAREPDSILPSWEPTHWRPLPASPSLGHADDGMAHGSTTSTSGGDHG